MKKFLTIVLLVFSSWLGFAQTYEITFIQPVCNDDAGVVEVSYYGGSPNALYYYIDDDLANPVKINGSYVDIYWYPNNSKLTLYDGAITEHFLIITQTPSELLIDAEQIPACFGEPNGKIKLNSITGSSGAGYQYHFGDNNWTAFTAAVTSAEFPTGNKTVYVKDDAGCENSLSINITTRLEIVIDAEQISACFGEPSGKIKLNNITGGSGTGHQYHFGDNSWTAFTAPITSAQFPLGNKTVYAKDNAGCENSLLINITTRPEIVIDAEQIPACFGENNAKIEITHISGGVPPYEYSNDNQVSWQAFTPATIINNLAPGNYTIWVKDTNSCTKSKTITVNESLALLVQLAASNVLCSGQATGTITATPSGGTAPYQYSIDGLNWHSPNTFLNLTANTYTVFIKDKNDCRTSETVVVGEPTELKINSAISNALCYGQNNGKITITASGGTAPYQYSIDGLNWLSPNTFLNLTANTYTVFIKDKNDCRTSETVVVGEPTELKINSAISNILCYGQNNGKITVTASGGTAPYEYSIDNGANFVSPNEFNHLSEGTYTILVRDNNKCQLTDYATITKSSELTFTTAVSDISCGGQMDGKITVTASGGTAPYQYSIDNGLISKSTNEFIGLADGKYNVVIRDKNACLSSISELVIKSPAPIDFNMNVNDNTCKASIIITDVTGGSSTYQYSINNEVWGTVKEFTNLSEQFYTISVKDNNNCQLSKDVELNMDYLNITPAELPNFEANVLYNVQLSSSAASQHTFVTTNKLPKGLSLSSDGKISGTPIVQPYNEFNITVKLTDANGCEATKNYIFKGDSGLFIPDIITPNGDGKNDHFMKGSRVIVFDRLGMKIFEGNDGWDGTRKGKVVAQDTYFYILFYKGSKKSGSISIFKE